ncbi:MAG: hypothetical protein ABW168_00335 [Sedimenticola sp.]
MGFNQATLNRLKKGQEPSGDLLRALVRYGRVSMRWLVSERGQGAPYSVSTALNNANAIQMLEILFVPEGAEKWSVVVATDDYRRFAVILHMPDEYLLKIKGKCDPRIIGYQDVRVVAGNISIETVRWLDGRDRANWVLPLTMADMDRLSTGHMGNLELFGYADGRKQLKGVIDGKQNERLIDKMKSSLHDSPLRERLERKGVLASEAGVDYASETKTEEMARRFKQLPADQQDLVLDLMRAMVEKKQHQTDTH